MVTMIWAQSANNVIGADGALPWHLPEDLAHFARLTKGCAVIMGRRTWESLPSDRRPLPGRCNIVLSSTVLRAPDVITVASVDEAIKASGGKRIAVIGGRGVFDAFMPIAERLEVTLIDTIVNGDTFAPALAGWEAAESQNWTTAANDLRYQFQTFHRRKPA